MSNIKNRYGWIDIARGIAILLVVYRHAFEGIKRANLDINRYLYLEYANIMFFSFRMPLFFIVSGIFFEKSYRKRGFEVFLKTKMNTILYPYFLWGALQISVQLAFSGLVNADRKWTDFIFLLYQPREVEQFWYLYALFNVSIFYSLLKRLNCNKITIGLLSVCLYFLSSSFTRNNIDIGFITDIFHYCIFFFIGDLFSSQFSKDKISSWLSWKLVFLLVLPFFGSQIYFLMANLEYSSIKYSFVETYSPVSFLIIALIGCLFTICISFILEKSVYFNWLMIIGHHSLYIYVSHVFATAATRIILINYFEIKEVPILLASSFCAGIIFPILLFKIVRKLNLYWVFTLDKKML